MPTIPNAKGPHRLDVAIGQRIRERRRAAGVTQPVLAAAVGVTFQQIQKYELGANRISFSRLVEIAGVLDCRLADLVEGLDRPHASDEDGHLNALVAVDGALDLLEAFRQIQNRGVRRALIAHVRAFGDLSEAADRA